MENIIPVISRLSCFCLSQGFSAYLKNTPNIILYAAIVEGFAAKQVLKPLSSIFHFFLLFLNFVHLFAGIGTFARVSCIIF